MSTTKTRERHAATRAAVRKLILDRCAAGPVTKAELNVAAGLVECWPHLRRLLDDGAIRLDGRHYVLASAPPSADTTEAVAKRAMALLEDLAPHRLAEIVEVAEAPPSTVSSVLSRCVQAGLVDRLGYGIYAKAGTYPRDLPVSTRDPMRLTKGEANALRYLFRRLAVGQGLGVEDLEHLAETVATDTGCTAREAAAVVRSWLEGLVAKGRVEVRGPRLAILRDVANARVQLALVPIGGTLTDSDEDHEDDDAPGEGLEGEAPWRA